MSRLAVLLAAVCFGTTGTAQALGPGGLQPLAVGSARILVGASLLVDAAASGRPEGFGVPGRSGAAASGEAIAR